MKRVLKRVFIASAILVIAGPIFSAAAKESEAIGSIVCDTEAVKFQVNCDFSYSPRLSVKDLTLTVGGVPLQIPDKGVSTYPVDGQTSAILFLVDVSDPNRTNTIQVRNRQHIAEILLKQKEYEKAGIATFDSEISVLSPIGSTQEENIKAINTIRAKGQATEFYKNILSAIQILKNTNATRKGLVLISDGKDEDRAYKYEDVLRAAKEENVVILGLGYAEHPSDAPYLQTIKRLADATNGQFINVSGDKLPSDFLVNPFDFLEKGGRVSFDSSKLHGKNEVVLTLGLNSGPAVALTTEVDFPDHRNVFFQSIDYLKRHWVYFLSVILIILAAIFFLKKYYFSRNEFGVKKVTYGYLKEYDGYGTQHEITKTAICIGRNENNDICLINDSISSHHAEIHRRRDGTFYIVDLGSTNGVFVNDKKITQVELVDGDVIELGEVRLNFSINLIL